MNKYLTGPKRPNPSLLHTPNVDRTDFFNSVNTLLDDLINVNFLRLSPIQAELGNPKFNAYKTSVGEIDGTAGKQIPGLAVDIFVPYLQKEDVDIESNEVENSITVSSKKHQDDKIAETDYFVRQLSRSSFRRTFHFGKEYPVAKAHAGLKDGILRITIPCNIVPPSPTTKKITIG